MALTATAAGSFLRGNRRSSLGVTAGLHGCCFVLELHQAGGETRVEFELISTITISIFSGANRRGGLLHLYSSKHRQQAPPRLAANVIGAIDDGRSH